MNIAIKCINYEINQIHAFPLINIAFIYKFEKSLVKGSTNIQLVENQTNERTHKYSQNVQCPQNI